MRAGRDHICWECPIRDGRLVCDPTISLRCPEPPLSAEEQGRVAQFFDGGRGVWLVHGACDPARPVEGRP